MVHSRCNSFMGLQPHGVSGGLWVGCGSLKAARLGVLIDPPVPAQTEACPERATIDDSRLAAETSMRLMNSCLLCKFSIIHTCRYICECLKMLLYVHSLWYFYIVHNCLNSCWGIEYKYVVHIFTDVFICSCVHVCLNLSGGKTLVVDYRWVFRYEVSCLFRDVHIFTNFCPSYECACGRV